VTKDETFDSYDIYHRQGRVELLDFLFSKYTTQYDVGVWSSMDRENTLKYT
jgi:hypothetical protein